MAIYKMGAVEAKFADLIWELEPVGSGVLVQAALKELGWKKSTTYTVLRKLCEKQIFHNEKSVVTSLMTRDQYYGKQCKQFVAETFDGSLPKFLAAFTAEEKMTKKELDALKDFLKNFES
ncbi:MAG: BlaI/MecI/CopY family transcriptional regulator [Lachnospiraceae bacterium]|nr:BlaI/MecI/CopY family transcriptional regulator [Lachnospiraceae bacterium]